ncbi:hypothetical protein JP0576_15420 [Helicobacter pylori]
MHYLVLKHFNPIIDPRLSVFNVKEFKRYNDIKKKMVKESEENAQIFSCNKILVAILDESCSIKVGVSGLVANNFLKNTLSIALFVSIKIIKMGIAVALGVMGLF